MIAGDLSITEGRIEIFGTDVTKMSVRNRVKLGIRRTYQTSSCLMGSLFGRIFIWLCWEMKEQLHI